MKVCLNPTVCVYDLWECIVSTHSCMHFCVTLVSVYAGAWTYMCVCMHVCEKRRHRESTLLGKLFDIHVEDVINRKQRDLPQCPTATRQGHTKNPQYKHMWYMDIYSYQLCQNIRALHEHCLFAYKNWFCDMSLTHKHWQLHSFFTQVGPIEKHVFLW